MPVLIVTGFLGSGKTTLISRLLRSPAFAQTAVIVNEFGEIALDHALIESTDETMLQLTSGCLCCAVQTDLVRTILTLAARRTAGEIAFARILIETSGLADPAPILHALMRDPALAEGHAIAGVLTLVDALLGETTMANHPEARRQVAMADRLLLSKTDLAAPSPALRAAVAALNPTAPVVDRADDPAALFAAAPAFPLTPPAAAAHSAGVESHAVLRTSPVPAMALTLWLQGMAAECGQRLLRLKGLVDIAEAPGTPAVIHAVQHVLAPLAFLPSWPDADRRTRIVFIGQGIPRLFPARLLDAVVAEVEEEIQAAGLRNGGG